jgi:SAM-dependent methyltransferase
MGIIGGALGYRILRKISRDGENALMDGSVYRTTSKLETLLGTEVWDEIAGKTVLDFGCGAGTEAVEMARGTAKKVIGLDIQDHLLEQAREKSFLSGVDDRCTFTTRTDERAEVITALDSFEHFDDPLSILKTMRGLLVENGCVLVSFGPTWLHPLGGHLFSVFPWAHLVFTESALIRWRSDFKSDGATRFNEVAGGLNKMTIRTFEKIVADSPFRFAELKLQPIRMLKAFHNRLTREFATATVRCKLVPR